VITGHDHSHIGVMLFLTEAARALPLAEVKNHVLKGLQALKAEGGGSSQTPSRALVLADGPSMAVGEITDKGYINQRLVLQRRATDVKALYEGPEADPRVLWL
jgi:feruloyl-CoA synthase